MIYISFYFYLFVAVLLGIYYAMPLRYRWICLLLGSLAFYYRLSQKGFGIFAVTLLLSYFMGIFLEYMQETEKNPHVKKWIPVAFALLISLPLILTKHGDFVLKSLLHKASYPWIVPLGLSFYTMQTIAYLVDISKGKIKAQKNLGKYILFVCFFPQIVQGPIPRYQELSATLYEGHPFNEREFCKGFHLILWGFFLKLMVADKASIVVNTIFDGWQAYHGFYVLVGGILYSIQLYADFSSCVCLARGTAALFGISLAENFRRPYLAESVKDFWGRWHISLSTWLRDYIYIPLGGNRKGKWRKYIHILITFTVSGLWHGSGYKYIFWGWMHAAYQIFGELSKTWQGRIYSWLGMAEKRRCRRYCQRAGTFFWIMLSWIIFRASGLKRGLSMLYGMFTVWNPWIFFDDSLLRLGLSWKEWGILLLSIYVLWQVDIHQEKLCIRDKILEQPLVIRWGIYLGAIAVIWVFGTYGFGFDAKAFIYGGF